MNHRSVNLMSIMIFVFAMDCVAAERVFEVHKTFSGSSAPIALDLNDDGIPAARAIGGGPVSPWMPEESWRSAVESSLLSSANPSHGEFSADNVSENVPVSPPTGRCAVNELEFEMIHYSSVQRYSNGDLLISGMLDGFTCSNPEAGVGYGVVQIHYLGGTGRFEGARGETTREFQGRALDPSGLRSSFTATETGTLILPATQ